MNRHYTQVVLTAGVTGLSVASPLGKLAREHGCFEFREGRYHPLLPAGENEEAALAAWRKHLDVALPSLTFEAWRDLGVELSLVHALHKKGVLEKGCQFVALHSDTLGGRAFAEFFPRIVEREFKSFGYQVRLREIEELDATDPSILRYGLGRFLCELGDVLRYAEPRSTCLAPVEGYRAMTTFAYILGCLTGMPSTYLHQDGESTYELPIARLSLKEEAIALLAPLVMKVGQGMLWADLDPAEQQQIEARPFIFEFVDDLVAVNALGQYLKTVDRFRHYFQPKIKVEPRVFGTLRQGGDLEGFVSGQLENLLTRAKQEIESRSPIPGLHHERDYQKVHPKGWSLYKGASNGQRIFRSLWHYDAVDDTLFVEEVWAGDHDRYEREAARRLTAKRPRLCELITWPEWILDL